MDFGQVARWALLGFAAAILGALPGSIPCRRHCQAMRDGGALGRMPHVSTMGAARNRSIPPVPRARAMIHDLT